MAMILDAFAETLVDRLANVIEEKAIMVLGVKTELQKLQRRMERIGDVLKDAEKRRIQEETVKRWVNDLKDVMYDADDIIDLCMIQGAGLLQDDHSPPKSSSFPRVRCDFHLFSCFPGVRFRCEIAKKIKKLNVKLQEISENKDKFNFKTSPNSSDAYPMNEASYRQSSSLPEPDVVGWDIRYATKSLVELLVSQHEQKCRPFAIVGMGGIGKTTLAQQIYNDPKVNDAFVLRSWIWVSKSFRSRIDHLLKEIIRNIGGKYGECTTISELQNILCEFLHGKSIFLVLDDVWDENIWVDLIKNAIERTTTKCKVLVTTRDRNTAVKMGATHIHHVNKLPSDVGWELLCKKVFTNNNTQDMQRLKDIGMKIVEKCDGLPVAIKAIAGVLVTKGHNKREWENVLNSDAWTITGLPEELPGALYLSYEALPSALKNCFLYCALYPRGYEFDVKNLVCHWIAEGYIEAKGHALMEDVAKSYYMELICRSFLQIAPHVVDMSICTIHDLMRALAKFFAGNESFLGDPQEEQRTKSMKKVRRLTVTSNRESVSILHLDCLRSLRLWTPPSLNTQVIGNLKHLRLLFLNGDKIEYIPDSIGDLVHLRLLDLESTSIQNLPNSLGNLINLQFLLLGDCKSLRILPNSITKLYNLRWLRVNDTPLNYVPKGIGKLEHLHHVKGLIIGNSGDDGEEGCDLEELHMLEKLSYLYVRNLEKSSSKSSSVLLSKIHLRELRLCCIANYTNEHIQQQEMDKIVQVFDELCPPPCLEDLLIDNFFGGRYPKWMSSTSIATALQELIYLVLINCSNCPYLPQLGQLAQLKYLWIKGATAVVSIGPEFLGNNGEPTEIAFPKLETLIFENMSNWEEWSLISGEEDNKPESSKPLMFFPHLIGIRIECCPKLKALPSGLNRVNISRLFIREAHSLSRISRLPALKELEVDDCPMLECVEKLESLQILNVFDNEEDNTSLPQWLISFLQQREEKHHDDLFKLHLECSAQALKGCLKVRPHWSFIQQVPRFIGYAQNQRMYMKYTREPYYYETNITDED